MSSPLVSIVVPVYNEEKNISLFYSKLEPVLRIINNISFEIIFVDDGSRDGTGTAIRTLAQQDSRVHLVEFVRNFGKEAATTAGISASHGQAVIMIDGDLQHPVELIPEFIRKWQRGTEVVVGIRKPDTSEPLFRRLASKIFYNIFNRISGTSLVPNATDYQLLDRVVVDEFNKFTERGRITRGLISWLGFRTDYLYFCPHRRRNGRARYSHFMLMRLAMHSFISLSLFPLKIAGYIGMIISAISLPMGVYIFLDRYIFANPFGFSFSGTAMLAVLTMFLIGLVLSALGFIALYIGAIHGEVINRPLYVIRKTPDNRSR